MDGVLLVRRSCKCFWQGSESSRIWNGDDTFAILGYIPYIQGQKYTLGSKYMGRKTQGEFVPIEGYCLKKVEESHCQIECVNGSFWVKDLASISKGTFIDGVKIGAGNPTPLNFGQILSLDVTLNDSKVEECIASYNQSSTNQKREHSHAVFWFKQRNLENNDVPLAHLNLENFSDGESSAAVFSNDLILSHIFYHLDVPSLKSCRLLSSQCNLVAGPLVKARTFIFLRLNSSYRDPFHSMRLLLYSHDISNFHPTRVSLNFDLNVDSDKETTNLDKKVFDDWSHSKKWLEGFLGSVTHLTTSTRIHALSEWVQWCSLISTIARNLTRLSLMLYIDIRKSGWDKKILLHKSFGQFPFLSTLSLDIVFVSDKSRIQIHEIKALVTNVTTPFHGIRSSTLSRDNPLIIEELGKVSMSKAVFHNLEDIVLHDTSDESLKKLLLLPQKLKKISLGNLLKGHFYPEDLDACLQKFGNNLEELKFNLRCSQGSCSRGGGARFREIPEDHDVNFPKMPKLRMLAVDFASQRMVVDGGQVDFAVHFPRLRELRMSTGGYFCDHKQRSGMILNTLFGNKNQVVGGLIWLEIDLPMHDDCERCAEFKEGLKRMFPNVRNQIFDA